MPVIGNKVAAATTAAATYTAQEQTRALTDKTKAEVGLTEAETKLKGAQYVQSLSSAGHLDALRDNVRQDMTAFEDRWKKIKEEVELIRAQQRQTDSQVDLNEQLFKKIRPAELQKLQEEAKKLTNESRLLGLKVPEALREAEFWQGPRAGTAMNTRHAGTWDKTMSNAIGDTAEQVDNAVRGATSAFRLRQQTQGQDIADDNARARRSFQQNFR